MGGELNKVSPTALTGSGQPKLPCPAHHNSDSTVHCRRLPMFRCAKATHKKTSKKAGIYAP